VEQIFEILL